MLNILQWWSNSPFLGILILYAMCHLILRAVRAAQIICRGWPPSHLDADGDFKDG